MVFVDEILLLGKNIQLENIFFCFLQLQRFARYCFCEFSFFPELMNSTFLYFLTYFQTCVVSLAVYTANCWHPLVFWSHGLTLLQPCFLGEVGEGSFNWPLPPIATKETLNRRSTWHKCLLAQWRTIEIKKVGSDHSVVKAKKKKIKTVKY